jgi:hypothetical protein
MKRLSDLDEKDIALERDKIETSGEALGVDSYEASGGPTVSDVDIFGVCKDCRFFKYIRYEFHGQKAYCSRHEARLTGTQRIVECSDHDQRGKMSLNQMMDIAYDLSYLTAPDHKRAGLV